jgi:hypothetical protein
LRFLLRGEFVSEPSLAPFPRNLGKPREDIMAETSLTLADEERAYLVELLERTLKDTRVEEHRTRAPAYREHVIQRENVIVGLLEKLGQPAP